MGRQSGEADRALPAHFDTSVRTENQLLMVAVKRSP